PDAGSALGRPQQGDSELPDEDHPELRAFLQLRAARTREPHDPELPRGLRSVRGSCAGRPLAAQPTVSLAGDSTRENLVWVCSGCNQKKAGLTLRASRSGGRGAGGRGAENGGSVVVAFFGLGSLTKRPTSAPSGHPTCGVFASS